MADAQETEFVFLEDSGVFLEGHHSLLKLISGQIDIVEYADDVMANSDVEDDDAEDISGMELLAEVGELERVNEGMSEQPDIRKERHKKTNKIPPHLQGLMREARLRFIQEHFDDAIDMCKLIVKEVPNCAEPYQLLSDVYERCGNHQEAFVNLVTATVLSKTDAGSWVLLGEQCEERGELLKAAACYIQASKIHPEVLSYHWTCISFYKKLDDQPRVKNCYKRLLRVLDKTNNPEYVIVGKEFVSMLLAQKTYLSALAVLENICYKTAGSVNVEDLNIAAELCIKECLYERCVKLLMHCCTAGMDGDRIVIHKETPLDLRVKQILMPLAKENAAEFGDLFLDVAEVCMAKEYYDLAIEFLSLLTDSQSYAAASHVWIKFADSLVKLGKTDEAVDTYRTVLTRDPGSTEARVKLASLYRASNVPEAINLLEPVGLDQLVDGDKYDIQAVYDHAMLYWSANDKRRFSQIACTLFDFLHMDAAVYTEMSYKYTLEHKAKRKHLQILSFYKERMISLDKEHVIPHFLNDWLKAIPLHEWWAIYMRLCHTLFDLGLRDRLESVTAMSALSHRWISLATKHWTVKYLRLISAYLNNSYDKAFDYLRDTYVEILRSHQQTWNLLNQIIWKMVNDKHVKYLHRLALRIKDQPQLSMLLANNYFTSSSFRYALSEYLMLYKRRPKDPLLCLLVALSMMYAACGKFFTQPHKLMVHACTFMEKYRKNRGECMEALYNMGRFMQAISLNHLAIDFYERALVAPPIHADFDLTMEIAHNMVVLYVRSGASQLAHLTMEKYLVV